MYTMELNITHVIGVVVIIVLLLVMIENSRVQSDLPGFWFAPDSFLQESGADSMILYMSPAPFMGTREAYLIVQQGDELLVNESFPVSTPICWGAVSSWLPLQEKYITFNTPELNSKIPQNLTMTHTPGKIILYSEDTIYGVFYKDGELSDKAVQEYFSASVTGDNAGDTDDSDDGDGADGAAKE